MGHDRMHIVYKYIRKKIISSFNREGNPMDMPKFINSSIQNQGLSLDVVYIYG